MSLFKDTSTVFVGNAVSSVLAIIFTILAARFLGPENWGIVAAVGSLVTILYTVGDLGMSASLLRFVSGSLAKGREKEAEDVFRTVFTFRVLTAFLFVLVLIFFANPLSRIIFNTDNPSLILFTALGLFGMLLLEYQVASVEARQNWRVAALFISLTNFFRLSLLLFIAARGLVSLENVLWVFAGSSVLALLISHFWQRTEFGLAPDWKGIVKKVGVFSGLMGANRVAASVNSRIDVLLLVQLAGAFEAGIYAASNRLAMGIPIIIGSFATVLAPRFASLKGKELLSFFQKAIGLSFVLVVALMLGVLIAPFIISLFGPEYERSGPVLQWLLLSFIPFALATPAVNVLIYAFQKPQILTVLTIIQLPFILLINFILIPIMGVFAPVVALFFVNITTMIVTYLFAWREFKKK